jgi:outer membrane protein TolC
LADHRLPFDEYNMSLTDAMDYAMKYRPEVLQASLSVQSAEDSIGVAKAGYRPTVGISAGRGWGDTDFPGTKNRNWTIAGTVTYSIFDGGSTHAKVREAEESLLKARESEQKVREAVQLEVKKAYLAIRSAAQKVEATKTAVTQAEESFKIATVRYQAGVGINLDVLDAQLNLNKAKINNIQALYDYNVGIATLEQAMGLDVRTGVVIPETV